MTQEILWDIGFDAEAWVEKVIGRVGFTLRPSGKENVWKVIFDKKGDGNKIWRCRGTTKEEGIAIIDEWLSPIERQYKWKMIQQVRNLQQEAKMEGKSLEAELENTRVRIGTKWYRWSKR